MARSTIVQTACAMLASASLHAEIVLETSEFVLEPGFIQYTVSAVGSGGEELNTFSGLELTGALHQVYTMFGLPVPTPVAGSHGMSGSLFGSGNEAYDTYFLQAPPYAFTNAPVDEMVGNSATTGLLANLPTFDLGSGIVQETGFGDRLAMDPLNGAITLTSTSTRIDFLQVVLAEGTQALLDVRIDGPGVMQVFEDFPIGELAAADPVLVGAPGPSEGPIDLTDAFLAGDYSDIDIILSNANGEFADLQAITAQISEDALGVFEATVVGNGVDLRLNTQGFDLARVPQVLQTATLTIIADGDPNGALVYVLQATIPEPNTMLIGAAALVVLAARRAPLRQAG
ncbi:MAG: hypothetical protein AAGJ46_19750 [Planctomycetota bacterium]